MGKAQKHHHLMVGYKKRQQSALNRVTGMPTPETQGRTLPMTPAQKKAQK